MQYEMKETLTNCMEQGLFWEANRFSATQEIPRILWKPKVYHRIRNISPQDPTLSQINPIHGPIPLLEEQIYCPPIYPYVFKRSLSITFPHQNSERTSPFPHTCRATAPQPLPPITLFSIWSLEQYWVSSIDHKAPRYVGFTTPL